MFQLHGYPQWYTDLKDQKGKNPTKALTNLADIPLHVDGNKGKIHVDGNYSNCKYG